MWAGNEVKVCPPTPVLLGFLINTTIGVLALRDSENVRTGITPVYVLMDMFQRWRIVPT
jgi:hypothetical protein